MLKDIADRSNDLGRLYAERLKSDDGYQVIDHRTVASTFQELLQKAVADPAPIIREQLALWSDLALLWQRTAARALFNAEVEPVIEPARQDKRFRSELWTQNPYFDYAKQSYLLMSRFFQSSVRNVTGVDPHTHHKAQFYTRQFVDAISEILQHEILLGRSLAVVDLLGPFFERHLNPERLVDGKSDVEEIKAVDTEIVDGVALRLDRVARDVAGLRDNVGDLIECGRHH